MPCWLPLTIRISSSAAAMLRAARCCRSACVSADSAGAHPAAAARARRPARQIAASPPASPAACWWQNHKPARSPTARPESCRAPRRLREHAESGGLPCRLQVCAESVLSQSGEPSRSRRGRPRDDAVRRRCLVRDGQLRGSQEGAQPRASVRAGRQPRRLRDAHPASSIRLP